jgi:hypothetical protein
MAIKENVLRKNLLTKEIDRGQVDSVFEVENLAGNIIEEYPFAEITEDDADYIALKIIKIKKDKINEIETTRKFLQYADIVYKDIILTASEKARDNLFKAAIISKGLNLQTLNWLDVNNKPVSLSIDDANAVIALLMQRDSLLYMKEAQLKLAVSACTSVDDILDKKGKVVSQGINSIQIQF